MALLVLLWPAANVAQVTTGGITGVVRDETGGALPGVSVTVANMDTGLSRSVITNDLGRYQVTALMPGRYSVTAELQSFTTVVRSGITVNVASMVDVDLEMKVATVQETVTVSGAAPLIESTRTDLSNVVTREAIESLPSKNQQYLDFALLMPAASENVTRVQGTGAVIGGARSKEGTLLVDGFYNLDEGFTMPKQRHSQDTIQEFQVVTFGGSAEFGRSIGGVINAVTKSGTNVLRGSAYGYFRDSAMNATPFGEKRRGTPKTPETRQQWGGSLGGPILRDKSFFFTAYERLLHERSFDNGISAEDAAAIGLPPEDVGSIPSFMRSHYVFGKWDHSLNQNHRLQASFSLTDLTDHNFTYIFPRATRSYVQQLPFFDTAYVFGWTGVGRGGGLLHEVKGSYFPRDYHSNGVSEGGPPLVPDGQINLGDATAASPPSVSISSVANFGSATLNNHIKTSPVQVLYASTMFKQRHTVKFGADYMYADYQYDQFSPYRGSYSFSSLADYLAGRYRTYTQAFGEVSNPRKHQYVSAFIQDSWQPADRLTVNYGVRYDLELNPKQEASGIPFGNDYNNIAPRFALSYGLGEGGNTFLKFTSGVYYDRIWNNATNDLYDLLQHPLRVSGTWMPSTAGAPVYPQTFTSQPQVIPTGVVNRVIMPDEVNVPMTAQAVTTLEHALSTSLVVSGSLIYSRSWFKEYRVDTNLRWTGTHYELINPEYRQIRQYRFDAPAEYVGGILELTRRGRVLGFDANLTFARSRETAGVFSFPNDQEAGIKADWGPQPDTPRIRGVVNGWYNITSYLQLSGAFRARTGLPVNPTAAGLDLNGDGRFGDRTPGLAPYSFEAPGSNSVDVRLTAMVPLRSAERRLSIVFEVFNLFNSENVRTVDSNYGPDPAAPLPRWMEPTSFFEAREAQIGVRLVF